MKDQEGFMEKMFWMCNGSQIVILTLSVSSCLIGFWQIPKLSVSSTKPLELDRLLLSSTIIGVYIYAIFGMIVGGLYFDNQKMLTIFCTNGLLLIQVCYILNVNISCFIYIFWYIEFFLEYYIFVKEFRNATFGFCYVCLLSIAFWLNILC